MATFETSNDAATPAVKGENTAGGDALFGQAAPTGRGVVGVSAAHTAVEGNTRSGTGVLGTADGPDGRGVVGTSTEQAGVVGSSRNFIGVWAETKNADQPALLAKNPTGYAGRFEGDVVVTGTFVNPQVDQRLIQLENEVADLQKTVAVLVGLAHPPGTG
ncbi:hypothetical protein ACFVVU_27715 [Kitasatospora sp. NPDC057965]|uniref:hypothetical protein n=1 Tax=Kitasatospora sp. NPDC057965 TaxID=3346291 RepID=UPI0036DDB42B